jgi:hypothetical protein
MRKNDSTSEMQCILDKYIEITMTVDLSECGRQSGLRLPAIPPHLFPQIASMACDIFKTEPMVLSIDHPVTVVGDLRGSLFDLLRVIHTFGIPPFQCYLFTGNLIDGREFSMETLALLLLFKIFHPESISLLRGRSEFFHPLVMHDTLLAEVRAQCTDPIFAKDLILMFAWMPIAAVVMQYAFVSHSGIPPTLGRLSELNSIQRPLEHFEPKLVEDIMWSEPCDDFPDVRPLDRGVGVGYGINAVRRFLKRTALSVVICGNRNLICGVHTSLSGLVVNVFSASGAGAPDTAHSGVIHVYDRCFSEYVFPLSPTIRRSQVSFIVAAARSRFGGRRPRIQSTGSLADLVFAPMLPPRNPRTGEGKGLSRAATMKVTFQQTPSCMRTFRSKGIELDGADYCLF